MWRVIILYFTEPLDVSVEHCISVPVATDNIQFKLHSLNTHTHSSTRGAAMCTLSRQRSTTRWFTWSSSYETMSWISLFISVNNGLCHIACLSVPILNIYPSQGWDESLWTPLSGSDFGRMTLTSGVLADCQNWNIFPSNTGTRLTLMLSILSFIASQSMHLFGGPGTVDGDAIVDGILSLSYRDDINGGPG